MDELQDQRAIENFRRYLRIPSVHPNPDYDGCVTFLTKLAKEIGLKSKVVQLDEEHPAIILTLEGQKPHLQSILLNSHMDVVPVFKDQWKHDPFEAYMDENGDIFARGAQDMKDTTMAEIEAIWRLKERGVKLKRTVHLTILPDEEIGSANGMAKFVETDDFKKLNIGFDLDEGVAGDLTKSHIFINERCSWGILIHCPGTTGHGSFVLKDTAGEKIRIIIDHFMDKRKEEEDKLSNPNITIGEVTTINLTQLQGGVQNNVVPPELIVGFDIRVAADEDHEKIEKWILDVCKKAGEGVYPEYLFKNPKATNANLETSPFWKALETTLKKLGIEYKLQNCCGATDARFARRAGLTAVGFAPFFNTKCLVHAHNEYMNKDNFLEGIRYYETIITSLANV